MLVVVVVEIVVAVVVVVVRVQEGRLSKEGGETPKTTTGWYLYKIVDDREVNFDAIASEEDREKKRKVLNE